MEINLIRDLCKQTQELLFSRKMSSKPYPSLHSNDNYVLQFCLGLVLFLDIKLSFNEHIQCILNKIPKMIGLIKNWIGQPC